MPQTTNGLITADTINNMLPLQVQEPRHRSNDSRQSQVCRRVIEEFAQKYSTIEKRSGSIGPRRQNPIVK